MVEHQKYSSKISRNMKIWHKSTTYWSISDKDKANKSNINKIAQLLYDLINGDTFDTKLFIQNTFN